MLPFVSLLWVGDEEIVAAGHDCQPILFKGNESGWFAPPESPRTRLFLFLFVFLDLWFYWDRIDLR